MRPRPLTSRPRRVSGSAQAHRRLDVAATVHAPTPAYVSPPTREWECLKKIHIASHIVFVWRIAVLFCNISLHDFSCGKSKSKCNMFALRYIQLFDVRLFRFAFISEIIDLFCRETKLIFFALYLSFVHNFSSLNRQVYFCRSIESFEPALYLYKFFNCSCCRVGIKLNHK